MSDESNYYGNLARAGAEGLLMGFGGEAEAYLKSKILGTSYDEELDKIEKVTVSLNVITKQSH